MDTDADRRGSLFQALVGIYRVKPKTVELAVRIINKEPSSSVSGTLRDALAMASTSGTLDALGKMAFAKRSSKVARASAARSLIRASRPNAASLDLLERMLDQSLLWEYGVLGIGTFARRFVESEQEELAKKGVASLGRQLKSATNSKKRSIVLFGIASSGSAEFFDAVLPYQKSKDSEEREAAIQAIRLMNDKRVEPALLGLLDSSDEATVRTALRAFRPRVIENQATIDRVGKLALSHASNDVRKEAVSLLTQKEDAWPSVQKFLQQSPKAERNSGAHRVAPPSSLR